MKIIISIGLLLIFGYLAIGIVIALIFKSGGLERETGLSFKATLIRWPQVLGIINFDED